MSIFIIYPTLYPLKTYAEKILGNLKLCNKFLKNSFEELLAKKFADYCYETTIGEKEEQRG